LRGRESATGESRRAEPDVPAATGSILDVLGSGARELRGIGVSIGETARENTSAHAAKPGSQHHERQRAQEEGLFVAGDLKFLVTALRDMKEPPTCRAGRADGRDPPPSCRHKDRQDERGSEENNCKRA
jgi:hypothetical protein